MNLVYGAAEGRAKSREKQDLLNKGLVIKTVNKLTNNAYVEFSESIMFDLLDKMPITNTFEYDETENAYTCYNDIVPHIYGEGATKSEAVTALIINAKSFVTEYIDNIDELSSMFNGLQQLILSSIYINIDNDQKVKEILHIV